MEKMQRRQIIAYITSTFSGIAAGVLIAVLFGPRLQHTVARGNAFAIIALGAAAGGLILIATWLARLKSKTRGPEDLDRGLLNALLDNIPDIVFFKDREGRLVHASRAMARVWAGRFATSTAKTPTGFRHCGAS